MWGRFAKDSVADDLPGSADTNMADGFMKNKANTMIFEPFLFSPDEQVGIDIIFNQG